MALPNPVEDVPPPLGKNLNSKQYNAILDDSQVDDLVRFTVLKCLEDSYAPDDLFRSYCTGEAKKGDEVNFENGVTIAHAMSYDNFFKGVHLGYFGNMSSDSEANLRDVFSVLRSNGATDDEALEAILRKQSMSRIRLNASITTWYMLTDESHLMLSLDEDLACRLALPSMSEPKEPVDFIVFVLSSTSLMNTTEPLRVPRFTDVGELRYLNFWQPGGYTSPIDTHREGFREAVGGPFFCPDDMVRLHTCRCRPIGVA